MEHLITLPCPACGRVLEIPQHIAHVACASCSTTLVVQRRGGIVFLEPAADSREPAAAPAAHSTAATSNEQRTNDQQQAATIRHKVAQIQVQVENVARDIEHISTAPLTAGKQGLRVGMALFIVCGVGILLAVAAFFAFDTTTIWLGLTGVAVVAGALGGVFYGEGRRAQMHAREHQQQKLQELEGLRTAGEAEIARLSRMLNDTT